ncbi:PaaI family thioesterase [Nocardia sp. NPDC048505]|uniref:PaaI family thioesterase n=1 Tax=unclassified Nocardia TaxID=2637762 RepID=UPI003403032E
MPTGNEPAPGIAAAQARLTNISGAAAPDYEQIRKTVDTLVPFVNLVGVRMTELGPGSAVAEIPETPEMSNHLGTVHAGALFLAAEVACAGAFSGVIAPRILHVRTFVLRSTKATFFRPARGRIRASGTVSSPVLAEVVGRGTEEQFDLTGKALLHDDGGALLAKVDLEYFCWLAPGQPG